jgi:hypothetical protein
MSKRFSSILFAVVIGLVWTATAARSAQTPGPGGTYYCWDRCQPGVNCTTSCYNEYNVLISCNAAEASCGGMGGVVGQGCGDGLCWWDHTIGYESSSNCPSDCPPDADHDGVLDGVDNCPTTSNSNQANCDGDSAGDVCDSENGTYGLVSGTQANCYLRSRTHFLYIEQNLFIEGLFRDSSACHSPDQWRLVDIRDGSCTPYPGGYDHDSCCAALWPSAFCSSSYFMTNQCHY